MASGTNARPAARTIPETPRIIFVAIDFALMEALLLRLFVGRLRCAGGEQHALDAVGEESRLTGPSGLRIVNFGEQHLDLAKPKGHRDRGQHTDRTAVEKHR